MFLDHVPLIPRISFGIRADMQQNRLRQHCGRDAVYRRRNGRARHEVGRENRHHIDLVDREPPINTGQAFPGNYQNALQRLWDDEGVRECWARAYEYALPENMP